MLNLSRFALFFIAACAIWTGSSAQLLSKNSAEVHTEQVHATLLAHAPQGVESGKPVWLGLQLQHQPHWHTYWQNPGDSGLPTTLQWTLPPGVHAGPIQWPTPQRIAIGKLANFGYEGQVLLPVALTLDPSFQPTIKGELEVRLQASWLVCRQECIPQEGEFVVRLPVRGSFALHGAAFAAAQAAAPQASTAKATAKVQDQALVLSVQGLPAAWQGKALQVYPEVANVLEPATAPQASDALASTLSATLPPATQHWQGNTWSATAPLSSQRDSSPASLALVLVSGTQNLRVHATITGTWPALAAPASVSPALEAALRENAAAQAASPATARGAADTPQGWGGWALALAAAVLGGLILNLMPCVLPVLAIKVLAFSHHQGSSAAQRAQGVAYTAGVVLSFVALGALMLALRATGEQLGWGFQLQSPAFVAALALLFTLIGFNLAGLLEVGSLLPHSLATLQARHPLADAFLSGVLAVAIASPCTAPFMGASLGYAITLPSLQALGIFAALGLGLALPYLLASWAPQVGRWLPEPGAWMVTLRRFMAFPMAATVLWLVWILGHLSGVNGAASLMALLLGLAMLVWSLGLQGRSRTVLASISIAVCAILAGAIGQNVLKMQPLDVPVGTGNGTGTGNTSDWQAWTPGRVEEELSQGKPVFVDFTAAWCITCQYNKQSTLSKPEVLADLHARGVTLLRADWTRRDPAITQALQALGRSGVPVYVLYAPGHPPVLLSEILSPADIHTALATL